MEQIINHPGLQVEPPALHPAARAAAAAALEASGNIQKVATKEALEQAAAAQAELKRLQKLAEASRKEMKAPLLEAGRAIDGIVKEFAGPLDSEARRIGKLSSAYLEAERRREAEARKKAEAAEQRRLAELQQKQRELVKSGKLDDEAAATLENEAIEDVMQIREQSAAEAKRAPAGAVLRKTWHFEVEDIAALHAARPELVELKPRNAAIRSIIKDHDLPGVRRWQESSMTMRTGPAGEAEARDVIDKYDY